MNTFASHPLQVTIFSGLSLALMMIQYKRHPFQRQAPMQKHPATGRAPDNLFLDNPLYPCRQKGNGVNECAGSC
jgi:hypothetical protein